MQSACRKFEDTLAIKPNDYRYKKKIKKKIKNALRQQVVSLRSSLRALYNYAVALQQLARITRVSSVSEAERLMQV